MNAVSRGRAGILLTGICLVAVLVGWLVSRLAVEWVLALVLGAIAVGLIFYDYRVGAVCLTILLPWSWSPLLPQTSGFNIINFVLLASVGSLLLSRFSAKEKLVGLPREVLWFYLLPIALAVLIAWQYLPIGEMNFPARIESGMRDSMFTPSNFLKSRVIKPLFFVVYAILLANAVRESKRPEWFLLPLGISAVIPALTIVALTLSGIDVTDRELDYLSGLGLQVNEFGTLLALAVGPLLYVTVGSGSRWIRTFAGVAFAIVSAGLVMTASRGAVVAYLVVLAVWLLRRRRLSDLLLGVVVAGLLAVAMPEQVQERLIQGLDGVGAKDLRDSSDPLTMGRGFIWDKLAPDFLDSPIWGKGLGSTAWNTAVTSGRLSIGHPHNMYLSILLDLGIFGIAVLGYLYYRYGRAMYRLSKESTLSPLMRDYFSGAFAAYLGYACFLFVGGYYTPHPEQTFLWFSLAFCYAYWHLAQTQSSNRLARRKAYGLPVREPVAARRESDFRR